MKKTVLFVLLEQYADWEAAYLSSALYMLGQGNYQVRTVSPEKAGVRSIGGFRLLPDYDTSSVSAWKAEGFWAASVMRPAFWGRSAL